MPPTDDEITRHHDGRPDSEAWVEGYLQAPFHITVVEYDDHWPADFVHAVREPWWHEHRLLKLAEPAAQLHVFGPDCPEVVRHLMFSTWLLEHPEDLTTYAEAKRVSAAEMNARPGGGTGMDYNRQKEPVVRAIYDRMFRAHAMLP